MLAAYDCDAVLFRNNVGMLMDRHGTPVRYGLCAGSADLIGWTMRRGVAVFTAVECKSASGRLSERQRRFLEVVNEHGGIGLVCRSV